MDSSINTLPPPDKFKVRLLNNKLASASNSLVSAPTVVTLFAAALLIVAAAPLGPDGP